MSYLLRDPMVLLVVGEGGVGEAVRDALVDTPATAVDAVPTVDAAVEAVAERDDVGCVLLGRQGPGPWRRPATPSTRTLRTCR